MIAERSQTELWYENQRIVVIEYYGRQPFSVITEEHWDHSGKPWFKPGVDRPNGVSRKEYDFNYCRRDRSLYQHNSGVGGNPLEYLIGKLERGSRRDIWAADDVRFFERVHRKGKWVSAPLRKPLAAIGYVRLKRPRLLQGWSRNPFEVANEGSTVWCPRCKDDLPADWTTRTCRHLEWCDDCGAWVLIDTRELIECGGSKCDCPQTESA